MHGIDVPSSLKFSDVLFLSRSCLHMPCLRQKVLADGEAVVMNLMVFNKIEPTNHWRFSLV